MISLQFTVNIRSYEQFSQTLNVTVILIEKKQSMILVQNLVEAVSVLLRANAALVYIVAISELYFLSL